MQLHHTSIKSSLRRGHMIIMLPMLLLVIGGYALFHSTMHRVDEVMEEVFDELLPFARVQHHLNKLSGGLRAYIYQGGELASEKIITGIRDVDRVMNEIARMRQLSARESRQMQEIRQRWVGFRKFWSGSRKSLDSVSLLERRRYLAQLKVTEEISALFESLYKQVIHELQEHRDGIAKKDSQVKLLILVMVSLTLLLSVLILLRLGRRITVPLEQLESGAEIIGGGDLSHRIALHGDDEFGRLAQVFNRMAADLEHIAGRDVLTGLLNRREFERRYEREIDRFLRYSHPMAVVMIDVDHFKSINDRFGHQGGDDVLRQLASLLAGLCRPTDTLARYGGEEFILVLSETELSQAGKMAERIREKVERHCFVVADDARLQVTVSLGLASVPGNVDSVEELIPAADSALYQAKAGGRNKVVCHHP